MSVILDKRLSVAASHAIPGKRFADVGTDHAYLPIYLCEKGISPGGVASDKNKGPLLKASSNIASAGLSDRIQTVQTDGLKGLELYCPEQIYILGMGGELISSIMLSSKLTMQSGISLVLQPMTRASALRRVLDESGFRTLKESIVKSGTRYYQILSVEFDGILRESSLFELEIGKENLEKGGADVIAYCEKLKMEYCKRVNGLQKAGKKTDIEERLIADISNYIDKNRLS